jgi:hypothetical protein
MWGLLGSTSLSFMLTRLTLPQLIPLIAAELGLTAAQTGLLLGSFFPVRQRLACSAAASFARVISAALITARVAHVRAGARRRGTCSG